MLLLRWTDCLIGGLYDVLRAAGECVAQSYDIIIVGKVGKIAQQLQYSL